MTDLCEDIALIDDTTDGMSPRFDLSQFVKIVDFTRDLSAAADVECEVDRTHRAFAKLPIRDHKAIAEMLYILEGAFVNIMLMILVVICFPLTCISRI